MRKTKWPDTGSTGCSACGVEPVRIGLPVEMVTRKIHNDGDERGIIVYGYKFRPAMQG